MFGRRVFRCGVPAMTVFAAAATALHERRGYEQNCERYTKGQSLS